MATVPQTLSVCALSPATVVSTPAPSLGPAQIFVQLSGLEKLTGVEHQPFFAQSNRSSHQFSTQLKEQTCKQKTKPECQSLGLTFHKTQRNTKTPRLCSQPHAPVTHISSSTPKIPGWNFSAIMQIYPGLKIPDKCGYGCTVIASYSHAIKKCQVKNKHINFSPLSFGNSTLFLERPSEGFGPREITHSTLRPQQTSSTVLSFLPEDLLSSPKIRCADYTF